MAIAISRLTARGRIYVPKEIRRRLGISPGSILEWVEDGEKIVIRRSGLYTSEDIHRALFEKDPEPRSLDEFQAGLRQYVKGCRAR